MSSERNEQPVYTISFDAQREVPPYHLYDNAVDAQRDVPPYHQYATAAEGWGDVPNPHYYRADPTGRQVNPVSRLESGICNNREVRDEEEEPGRSPTMMTCRVCQQEVLTDVHYKIGRFAKLLCLILLFFGLVTMMGTIWFIPLPLFLKSCKDVYHSCPCCRAVLHIKKKEFCDCRKKSAET